MKMVGSTLTFVSILLIAEPSLSQSRTREVELNFWDLSNDWDQHEWSPPLIESKYGGAQFVEDFLVVEAVRSEGRNYKPHILLIGMEKNKNGGYNGFEHSYGNSTGWLIRHCASRSIKLKSLKYRATHHQTHGQNPKIQFYVGDNPPAEGPGGQDWIVEEIHNVHVAPDFTQFEITKNQPEYGGEHCISILWTGDGALTLTI